MRATAFDATARIRGVSRTRYDVILASSSPRCRLRGRHR